MSPFRPQANRIRDAAYSRDDLKKFLIEADFQVGTAHSFQGDERDLMIFSPVVTDGIAYGSVRFLNANSNLFNVAVTRARAALVVVGDANSEAIKGVTYLAAFRDYAMDVKDEPALLDGLVKVDHGPTYPDVVNPDQVSTWERLFYRELYAAGIVTSPQVPIENYRLDLAVIDGVRRLDIEVDGEHYHRAWSGELARRDQLRNQRLIELGWDIQRFWVYQIRDDMKRSVARVRWWLENEGPTTRSRG
ncbi:MAG: AAA domain-containing protein [Acidimicrobiia bacterium]